MLEDETSGAIPTPDPSDSVRVSAIKEAPQWASQRWKRAPCACAKFSMKKGIWVAAVAQSAGRHSARSGEPAHRTARRATARRQYPHHPSLRIMPVVRMQLTLKEEVHVKTTETQEDVIHRVLTSKEELVIERRVGPEGPWRQDSPADWTRSGEVVRILQDCVHRPVDR